VEERQENCRPCVEPKECPGLCGNYETSGVEIGRQVDKDHG